jgi:Family of unknown function (DUF5336)
VDVVVYSAGNPGQAGQPNPETSRLRGLFAAIAVLGLAAYGVSFGPVTDSNGGMGWYVRFAALAGLVAAFGLLPKGKPLPLVSAVLAAMGFLDGLSSVLTGDANGWALTVIVVLNAAQTAVAVAALLLGPNAETDSPTAAGYEAYVDYYNQAVRNYYSQQAQSAPPPEQAHAYGQAYARGEGYANTQATGQMRRTQRPSQYGDYAELDHAAGRQGAPAQREAGDATARGSAGMPSVGHTEGYTQPPQQAPDQSAWPSSPA